MNTWEKISYYQFIKIIVEISSIQLQITRMRINREIEEHLKIYAKQRPASIITGGRQTGKASLLRRL